jgi:hypothetical protein
MPFRTMKKHDVRISFVARTFARVSLLEYGRLETLTDVRARAVVGFATGTTRVLALR